LSTSTGLNYSDYVAVPKSPIPSLHERQMGKRTINFQRSFITWAGSYPSLQV
jgi:hypothetical protein